LANAVVDLFLAIINVPKIKADTITFFCNSTLLPLTYLLIKIMNTKHLFLSSLLYFILLGLYAQEAKMTPAKIKEATVFFTGAELTHETTITLQKGNNELKISGLSPVLDKNSIKIKTLSGVLVSSFEFSTDFLTEKTINNEEIKKLEENIANTKKQLAKINTNIKINKDLLSILQKGVIKNVEGSESGLGINDLKLTLDYFKTKSLETEELIRADTEEKQKIEENVTKLQLQLNQESKKNDKLSGVLSVSFIASNAGNTNIIISYYTHAARWIPYYDINVPSIQKPIRITTKAKIAQTSGIDWNNIKLSLSTATPSFGKVAPLFKTWFLRFIEQIKPRPTSLQNMKQNSYSYTMDFAVNEVAYERFMAEDEDHGMDYYVQQSENQLNITYDIALPYTLQSNGKDLNIELQNQEVNANYKYYSVPKLDAETYLLGEIADWQKLNLMNGNANVTYDGTYVGETYIDASSTQEQLVLTLGSDKRVPVKREKLSEFSSTKFVGNETRQQFCYQLTVRNNQNVPVTMTLKEQYPISTQKEIEVELLKETTKWSHNNSDVGIISWEFELQPGEQKIFKMAYLVKYPKGKRVNL
jgi:uncharacterized protein (TIGR02231 family)